MFTPRHPRTKPTIAAVDAAASPLDEETLIARAVEGTVYELIE